MIDDVERLLLHGRGDDHLADAVRAPGDGARLGQAAVADAGVIDRECVALAVDLVRPAPVRGIEQQQVSRRRSIAFQLIDMGEGQLRPPPGGAQRQAADATKSSSWKSRIWWPRRFAHLSARCGATRGGRHRRVRLRWLLLRSLSPVVRYTAENATLPILLLPRGRSGAAHSAAVVIPWDEPTRHRQGTAQHNTMTAHYNEDNACDGAMGGMQSGWIGPAWS